MSDFAWIAFIIIVYIIVIRPLMQGVLQTPPGDKAEQGDAGAKKPEVRNTEYVDYEEVK